MSQHEALQSIVANLKDLVSKEEDIAKYVSAIIDAATQSHDNQLYLGSLNLPTYLLTVLSTKPYDSNVETCHLVFTAVLKLCRRGVGKDTSCWENCDQVLANRGGQRILDSLANFILEYHDIIGTACHLIMCLAADSSDRQRILAEEGVSVALAAVLFQYTGHDYAAEFGSRAVRNLSTNDDVANALVSEGIAEALVKVLKESKSLVVIDQALWAVVNLSCNANIANIFGSVGIFEVIYNIMNLNISNESIIESGSASIRNLISDSQRNVSIIVKNKDTSPYPSLYTHILREYCASTNTDLVEVILWACANLASCVEIGVDMYKQGILVHIERICYSVYAQGSSFTSRIEAPYYEILRADIWLLRNINVNCVPEDAALLYKGVYVNTIACILETSLPLTYISVDTSDDSYSDPTLGLITISLDVWKCLLNHIYIQGYSTSFTKGNNEMPLKYLNAVLEILTSIEGYNSVYSSILVLCVQIVDTSIRIVNESTVVLNETILSVLKSSTLLSYTEKNEGVRKSYVKLFFPIDKDLATSLVKVEETIDPSTGDVIGLPNTTQIDPGAEKAADNSLDKEESDS